MSAGKMPLIISHRRLISLMVLCLSVITIGPQYLSEGWDSWLESELIFATMAIGFPWIALSIYNNILCTFPILKQLIDLPDDQLSVWFSKRISFTFGNRVQYLVAIGLMIAGLYTTYIFWVPWQGINLIFFYCMMATFFCFTGIVGWYYLVV